MTRWSVRPRFSYLPNDFLCLGMTWLLFAHTDVYVVDIVVFFLSSKLSLIGVHGREDRNKSTGSH